MSQGAEKDLLNSGESKTGARKKDGFFFWAPRMLTLMFAFLLSLFALDVFQEQNGFWFTIVAFVVHLVPAITILVVLALAWRWEWVGTVIFALLATVYILKTRGTFVIGTYILISGSLYLIAILFLISWIRNRIRTRHDTVEAG